MMMTKGISKNNTTVANGTQKPAKPTVATNVTRLSMIDPNDCKVPNPGNDGVSSLVWSPTSNFLASSNWDSCVRCWDVKEPQGIQVSPTAKFLGMVKHADQKPVLDCCFNSDGTTIFSAGCDNAVRMWKAGEQPNDGVARQIGSHDAPVKSVRFLPSKNLVVSGGWDKKVKFWDGNSDNPAKEFKLNERVYGLDLKDELMVVITADKKITIYNVKKEAEPVAVKSIVSTLDCQSRCVSCLPNQNGFAVGGIDGRVAPYDNDGNIMGFTSGFSAHTKVIKKDKLRDAFAVNDIAYNSHFGTFATVGSDCRVKIWDIDNKMRLKKFGPLHRPITCAAFNTQGNQNLFAYACSYDWSKGSTFHSPGSPNEIFIHKCTDDEIKRKKRNLRA